MTVSVHVCVISRSLFRWWRNGHRRDDVSSRRLSPAARLTREAAHRVTVRAGWSINTAHDTMKQISNMLLEHATYLCLYRDQRRVFAGLFLWLFVWCVCTVGLKVCCASNEGQP